MQKCLFLAQQAEGYAAPNPMVGCVIVHKGAIVSEGYHKHFGAPHAEVDAIEKIKDKTILKECELYVNLEPCAHHGKTPPCADLILKYEIPKVFVGNLDINPIVSGKGIQLLRSNGVKVETDILSDECRFLNRRFFTFHKYKRPYIVLKWTQSQDGFIWSEKQSKISCHETDIKVHQWRSEEAAILVGHNTVLKDNPNLNVRHVKGKNPIRISFDKHKEFNSSLNILNDDAKTIIFSEEIHTSGMTKYVPLAVSSLLKQLTYLHQENILSILVEGGANTISKFLSLDIWDEVRIITSNHKFGEGIKAPYFKGISSLDEISNSDTIQYFYNIKNDFLSIKHT